MVESVKKNLVAKFDNFDELYEQKILENEMVVKSLKSEIDAKCLELHETIDKNYLLLSCGPCRLWRSFPVPASLQNGRCSSVFFCMLPHFDLCSFQP